MAFKLRSPFPNTEDERGMRVSQVNLSGGTVGRNNTGEKASSTGGSANDLEISGGEQPEGNTEETTNADGVTTGETTEVKKTTGIEELRADAAEPDYNRGLNERIENASNVREEARLKARLKRRERRQENAADRINKKSEARENDPLRDAREQVNEKAAAIKAENKLTRRSERAKTKLQKAGIESGGEEPVEDTTPTQQELEDKVGAEISEQIANDPDLIAEQRDEDERVHVEMRDRLYDMAQEDGSPAQAVGTIASMAAPIIKKAAVGAITNKMQEKMESPNNFKPNRAGGPLNRNQLQMAPTLKTYKQSHSGATAALQMQNIAQAPLEYDPPKGPKPPASTLSSIKAAHTIKPKPVKKKKKKNNKQKTFKK